MKLWLISQNVNRDYDQTDRGDQVTTKKAAKKKAAKKAPKMAAKKQMSTDEALAMLREWREAKRLDRRYLIDSPFELTRSFMCSMFHNEGKSWNPCAHVGAGATEAQAITKALAAAKKAGHA